MLSPLRKLTKEEIPLKLQVSKMHQTTTSVLHLVKFGVLVFWWQYLAYGCETEMYEKLLNVKAMKSGK